MPHLSTTLSETTEHNIPIWVYSVFETHAGPSARDHQLWRRSSNSSEFVARWPTKCLQQGIKMYERLKIKLH